MRFGFRIGHQQKKKEEEDDHDEDEEDDETTRTRMMIIYCKIINELPRAFHCLEHKTEMISIRSDVKINQPY